MPKFVGAIHIAKNQLGMDDETYRAVLMRVTGKDSCAKMMPWEKWKVLEEMKRLGFQKKPTHKGKNLINDPQARKIRALWLTMADCGIVKNRSEKALASFMRRQTGRTLEDANIKQCQAVIEILKAWFNRCEDPRMRAICRAVLEEEETSATLDSKIVVRAQDGRLQ